jgi:hypothetical protein
MRIDERTTNMIRRALAATALAAWSKSASTIPANAHAAPLPRAAGWTQGVESEPVACQSGPAITPLITPDDMVGLQASTHIYKGAYVEMCGPGTLLLQATGDGAPWKSLAVGHTVKDEEGPAASVSLSRECLDEGWLEPSDPPAQWVYRGVYITDARLSSGGPVWKSSTAHWACPGGPASSPEFGYGGR